MVTVIAPTIKAHNDFKAKIDSRVDGLNTRLDNIVTTSPNLLDETKLLANKYVQYDGQLVDTTNYKTSDYIPVVPSSQYTITNPRSIAYYDDTYTFVSFVDSSGTGNDVVTVPAGVRYMRCSFGTGSSENQVVLGSTIPAYSAYGSTAYNSNFINKLPKPVISDVSPEQVTFIKAGKNLYDANSSNVVKGQYLNTTNGSFTTYASYNTGDYILVKGGTTYTLKGARKFVTYNTSKVYQSGLELDGSAYTFTPSGDVYIRFSYPATNLVQLEVGSTATPWEAYALELDPSITVAKNPATSPNLTVTRNGDDVVLVDNGVSTGLQIKMNLNYGNNKLFNYISSTLGGTVVTTSTDDVSPVWLNGLAVGANHGYLLYAYPNPDGKTQSDVGSTWTDGVRNYVLLKIADDGKLYMGVDAPHNGAQSKASAPITHVSGATKTGTVEHTGGVALQLYPTIGRRSITLRGDNKRLNGNFTGSMKKFEIVESYDIFDYSDILAKAKTNVGGTWWTQKLAAVLTREITYTFYDGGVMLYHENLYEGTPATLTELGFVQSNINKAAGSTKRYMSGVKTKSGFDFDSGVVMDSYATSIDYSPADAIRTNNPPLFVLDVLHDASGAVVGGFILGYYPTKDGMTSSKARSTASEIWDMRSTKKIYPRCGWASGTSPQNWNQITGHAYRIYLGPEDATKLESNLTGNPQADFALLRGIVNFT